MALRSLVGGWFLYPRRRERRVEDHHLAVLLDPAVYGLTREDIERIGPRNRIGILTEVLRNGWVRVRVPPTRDAVIHIEFWTLDRARARRIERWLRGRGAFSHRDDVYLGVLATGRYERIAAEPLRATLRKL